ncbi:MAG TPA: nucleotidyltransferase family protein [Candidatus Dormibacteraeota bacterium]
MPDPPAGRPLLARGIQLAAAAEEAGFPVRLLGGVGVGALLGERWPERCRRDPGDIDLAARGRDRRAVTRLLEAEGFVPDREFNALHGRERLLFRDRDGVKLDVVLDVLRMCHTISLAPGFEVAGPALPAWLLLVTKLQVVELTEKDRLDIAALLVGCRYEQLEVDLIARDCADDWGLWRSMTGTLRAVRQQPPPLATEELSRLRGVAARLLEHLETAPKTLRWRLRDRVGERVRWYELPESP